MPYKMRYDDFSCLYDYATSAGDICKTAELMSAMLSETLELSKYAEFSKCDRVKSPLKTGRKKTDDITVDGTKYPRCMCLYFQDSENQRGARTMLFYIPPPVIAGIQVMGNAPREITESISRFVMRNFSRPELKSVTFFTGGWRHYGSDVITADSERLNFIRRNLSGATGCSRILDGIGDELYFPKEVDGFVLDQLF